MRASGRSSLRSSLFLLLLLALPAVVVAAEHATPPLSAANLVRYRPAAWQLPGSPWRAGMRVEPETGDASAAAMFSRRGATTAALRQSASETVHRNADGSLHATLGAAFRSWTVVHLAADGKAVTDCVEGLENATKRVEATRQVPR